ncbi:cytochrome b N-terminal domain-containing protein [Nitrospira sp. Kam-Ns4a]
MVSRLYEWLDSRLRLKPIEKTLLDEPIPGGASWIYVFGSVTLFAFLLQMLTGMFLMLSYAPTADHAYESVRYIQEEVPFGAFIRGLHHWGASLMMVAIGLHMLQVFLYGAYKRPRELLWMVGVALFLITLMFGFSGYLLPWDQRAYWATQVGVNIVGTIPLIGDTLVRIIRGGPTLGTMTLSRFFALHTAFLPWLLMALVVLHLIILRRVGPAGPWDPTRAAAIREPFWPRQVAMDAIAMFVAFALLVGLALGLPPTLADRANPADTSFTPVPEWYFLFYYELLKYFRGRWEILGTVILPVLFYTLLFLVPFWDRGSERRPFSRPVVLGAGGLFLAVVLTLLAISLASVRSIPETAPSVTHGKQLYQSLGCAACHRIHGEGEAVGPDLSTVGAQRDADWLMRHWRDPQAVVPGSLMPAYAGLSDADLKDLTDYMLSLK